MPYWDNVQIGINLLRWPSQLTTCRMTFPLWEVMWSNLPDGRALGDYWIKMQGSRYQAYYVPEHVHDTWNLLVVCAGLLSSTCGVCLWRVFSSSVEVSFQSCGGFFCFWWELWCKPTCLFQKKLKIVQNAKSLPLLEILLSNTSLFVPQQLRCHATLLAYDGNLTT